MLDNSQKFSARVAFSLVLFLCLLLLASFKQKSYAQPFVQPLAQESTDEKLSNVKDAINKQKTTIKQVDSKRQKLLSQLKNDDLAIAKIINALNKTDASLKQTKKRLNELVKEKSQINQAKKQQETVLAKQLRTAYSTGHHDYLKLILNQQDPSSVQRTVTYYQYLNKARIKEIEQYKTTIAQLVEITEQQKQQAEQLQHLEKTQKQQKVSLESNKEKRQETVAQLSQQLLSSKQMLAKLEEEEADLVAALARVAELSRQEVDLTGLSKLKRKLSWPVKGRINRSFGSRKQDYLKWKGVLMAAPLGRQVKTIHNGTVLFADWLKGYGLVTVIDHGEGYMSLYGHNQALLKSVGERVETGEPIALVGQSGGQSQPALYFEIRYNGQAVNPKLWCR
ncbi:peptidoglycan DD-metalloendopeptidase family protein [Colwellia sp. 1_MG-2023]|uniref:murein hydrolase activator EnvC family protein n=1 Tax=Colwellia sp. 1_MG-2023 TaxID=3062649 RepID=UPI0026E403BD|nr:peptidoglycan DD-metalloendopeptidase family protein [Colwellia sp. 1_MG-2023]MDO6445007.1 peptidoglycan DD-metalloendopeptidase family protein [Colwellia sp. 1_MG-2023]